MLPLTVVIAWVDFVLIRSTNSVVFGVLLVIPHIFLMLAYLRTYISVLAARATPGFPSINEIFEAVSKAPERSALRTCAMCDAPVLAATVQEQQCHGE
jgi:hypothetical protein